VVVDSYEALDAICGKVPREQPGRRVLVDLAAQTHSPLVKWMDESEVLNLADESGNLGLLLARDDAGRDSVDLLSRLLDQFGSSLSYVLVRNQLRRRRFRPTRPFRANKYGPRVSAPSNNLETSARGCGAENRCGQRQFLVGQKQPVPRCGEPGSGLGLMERQRLKMWLNHVTAELATVDV